MKGTNAGDAIMKVYKPSSMTNDHLFECWNCQKKKDVSELASIPFAFKAGLTVIMFALKAGFFPNRTCKSCEGQALAFGFLGWIIATAIVVYAVLFWWR